MRRILFVMAVVAVSLSTASADYMLTVQTDPPFVTTLSPFIGEGQVSGTVELEAARFVSCPYVYRFDHWEGAGIADPNAAQTSVVVDAPLTITAVFVDDRRCGDECHDDNVPGDLDHNCIIDLGDLAVLAGRWLHCTQPVCDELPILIPEPSKWLIEPRAVADTVDSVMMQAVPTYNTISPEMPIQYYFDCLTDNAYDSGWIGDSSYTVGGLEGALYEFTVFARDVEGHTTQPAPSRTVMPGTSLELPQAQWLTEPYYTVISGTIPIIGMGAESYVNYPEAVTLPIGYSIRYQFERDDMFFPSQTSTQFTDMDISVGATYTYRVRMLLYHDASADMIATGPFSEPVQVTAFGVDLEPPVPSENQDPEHPYKAQHAMSPASVMTGNWYQVVFAVEAVDPSGVEYRFICDNAVYSSGGSIDPGPAWRNSDNVGVGTSVELYPGGISYQGSAYQVPHVYMVSTGIIHQMDLIWFIVYRDRSVNQNMGDFSDGLSESGQVVPPPF